MRYWILLWVLVSACGPGEVPEEYHCDYPEDYEQIISPECRVPEAATTYHCTFDEGYDGPVDPKCHQTLPDAAP